MEALIGPKTVNTIPMETLEAFRDHGEAKNTLEENMDKADEIVKQLEERGIDMEQVSQKLEEEGIEKFKAPYSKMLKAIDKQKELMQA